MASMKYQLDYLGIPYTRVSGCDERDLQAAIVLADSNNATVNLVGVVISAVTLSGELLRNNSDLGQAGCTFSHMNIYQLSIDAVTSTRSEDGPILVLEDDVLFDADFKAVSALLLHELEGEPGYANNEPYDWDLLTVGYCAGWYYAYAGDSIILGHQGNHTCTHAYVMRDISVSRKLLRLLNAADTVRIPTIDKFMNRFETAGYYPALRKLPAHVNRDNTIRTFTYVPNNIVVQDRESFETEISSSASQDYTERVHKIPDK
jgi:GR25 family glycosyltransferase involved in LPS biosynthesis